MGNKKPQPKATPIVDTDTDTDKAAESTVALVEDAERVNMATKPVTVSGNEIKPGVYIAQYPLPHPTDSTKIYPGGGASFTVSSDDLADPWIEMQVEQGVFMFREDLPK